MALAIRSQAAESCAAVSSTVSAIVLTPSRGSPLSHGVNPLSGVTWFWRALRGGSVTFGALFALGVLGLSVVSAFRHLLHRMGAPWLVLFVAPFVVVTILAKKEPEWMPDPVQRRKWSRRLVFGSLVIFLLVTFFAPRKPEPPTATTKSQETFRPSDLGR